MKVVSLLEAKRLSVGLSDREFEVYIYLRQIELDRIFLERLKRKFELKPCPKSFIID